MQEVIGSNSGKSIGIDVGVKVFAYTHDGQTIKHINGYMLIVLQSRERTFSKIDFSPHCPEGQCLYKKGK